jgi:acetyl-CoA carboxylase biotin carboxyl carrier protein
VDNERLKDLIKSVSEHGISEFRLENKDLKVVIKTKGETIAHLQPTAFASPPQPEVQQTAVPQQPAPQEKAAAPPEEPSEQDDSIYYVTSPIVGTFYRSPSPTSDAYVEVGSQVKTGAILCIVEAMKLMNEIPSEVNGTVIEILAENAQPVEFGEKLLAIKIE